MFFLAKSPERGRKERKKEKCLERTAPEPEFEKQSHFYDTRMTFRKQEIKTPHTCISEEGKQTGWDGDAGIHEYIITPSVTFDPGT